MQQRRHASHPDNLLRHANVNQELWLKESEAVINEFAARLPDPDVKDQPNAFKDFTEAFEFLAKKRNEVAVKLGHGKQHGRTLDYGLYRTNGPGNAPNEPFYENRGPGVQAWSGMLPKVYDLVNTLILNVEHDKSEEKQEETTYSTKGSTYTYEKVHDDPPEISALPLGLFKRHHIQIKSPHPHHIDGELCTRDLVKISKTEYTHTWFPDNNPDEYRHIPIRGKYDNLLCMIYAHSDEETRKADFKLLNKYFWQILKVRACSETALTDFLKQAAIMSHLLACLLPVYLGNAGITEWMLRGIAYKKGIQLGYFNHGEGISWDFKALLTPSLEDYCQWYVEKAFEYNRLLTSSETREPFSYSRSIPTSVKIEETPSPSVTKPVANDSKSEETIRLTALKNNKKKPQIIKDKFIAELSKYISDREQEQKKYERQSKKIVSQFFRFSAKDKIDAATKLKNLFSGKLDVQLSHVDIQALHGGKLGRLIAKYRSSIEFPKEFIEKESSQLQNIQAIHFHNSR